MKRYIKPHNLILVALLAVAATLVIVGTGQTQVPYVSDDSPQDRPITSLRDLNNAFVDIAAEVKPAVVTVSTERILRQQVGGMSPFMSDPFFRRFFGPQGRNNQQPQEREYRQEGLGSGVIVGADGLILTNNHVVEDVDSITVRTYSGDSYKATLLGADPKTDVAVLKIDGEDLPFVKIADSDKLQVGEMVLAIGSPLSQNLAYTVTQGIVSATGRSNVGLADYEDFIQTDAAINRGNSGGPLVNLDGALVGLNTAILSSSGGFQGIGLAIPSNMAVNVMESVVSEGRVVRGWLGVSIQDVTKQIADAFNLKESNGALVGDVVDDSPARKAGLEAGDVITRLDGRKIDDATDLRNRIAETKPGTDVKLGIMRGDKDMDVSVELGELEPDKTPSHASKSAEDRLGFAVQDLTHDLSRQYGLDGTREGAVVTSVDQTSNAFAAGLREGDLIIGINRQRVVNADDVYGEIDSLDKGSTVLLHISRDGNGFFMTFTID